MMNKIELPKKEDWKLLCKRAILPKKELERSVESILEDVYANKDKALKKYSQLFDNVNINEFLVPAKEINEAEFLVNENLKKAILLAKENITKFHSAQKEKEIVIETSPGVECWRKSVAIEKVGLYIPGGTAPLFSTILMLGIPARLAGCKEIIMCTPPNSEGKINPTMLYTAKLVGVTKIFKVGGAQAIAAMTYGTESIPKVYKIFGPGNQYVTKAKEFAQRVGVAIDMPAGPSEVLVIADRSCNPEFVAADLLSQAEHGPDSQVILVSNSGKVASDVLVAMKKQVQDLPRKEIALKALANSRIIILKSIELCIEFSNIYAPEHLIIASETADTFIDNIVNAGSVFLGNYSCESAGDYASGTNHTLPTNGYAKSYSGVSLNSFTKQITFQRLSKNGIKNIGSAIECMAEEEGLYAHKNAVSLRLKELKDV